MYNSKEEVMGKSREGRRKNSTWHFRGPITIQKKTDNKQHLGLQLPWLTHDHAKLTFSINIQLVFKFTLHAWSAATVILFCWNSHSGRILNSPLQLQRLCQTIRLWGTVTPAQFGDMDLGDTATKKAKSSKIALTIFIHAHPKHTHLHSKTCRHTLKQVNTMHGIHETSL